MDGIKHILFTVNSSFAIRDLFIVTIMSLAVGFFICFSYYYSHKNINSKLLIAKIVSFVPTFAFVSYTLKFDNNIVSLIFILITIAVSIYIMTKRFVKLNNDQLFLVWALVAGILCGEEKLIAAAILSVVVFVILILFRAIDDDMSRLLIIKTNEIYMMDVQALVFKYFNRKAKLLSKKQDDEGNIELVYRVSIRILNTLRNKRTNITTVLENIVGVKSAVVMKEEEFYD